MLILNRKDGEAIVIDGGIRIVVLGSDSSGVRLGIDAPRSISIVREEIAQGIADENVRAGATPEQKEWLRGVTGGTGPTDPGTATGDTKPGEDSVDPDPPAEG